MKDGVLVDTSVFIDYLCDAGRASTAFAEYLADRRVILSPFVRLEVLSGVRRNERAELASLLDSLPTITSNTALFSLAESFLALLRKRGIVTGLVDYLIALQALSLDVPLFTLDRMMQKTARAVGVECVGN